MPVPKPGAMPRRIRLVGALFGKPPILFSERITSDSFFIVGVVNRSSRTEENALFRELRVGETALSVKAILCLQVVILNGESILVVHEEVARVPSIIAGELRLHG
jgi:hypothetical protein